MYRRTTLRAISSVALAGGLAGCLGGLTGPTDQSPPTPIDLSGTKADDQGGMVIGRHGGPNGQIFYANHSPTGHDNPAWFHTLVFGLFPYYFDHKREGWTAKAIYVTDYSTVEYSLEESTTLPAPTGAETFGDATEMTYVAGSRATGGMGPTLVPFSRARDAEAFVSKHGGRTLVFSDVTPLFVDSYARG